jgi:hypothetical protein
MAVWIIEYNVSDSKTPRWKPEADRLPTPQRFTSRDDAKRALRNRCLEGHPLFRTRQYQPKGGRNR